MAVQCSVAYEIEQELSNRKQIARQLHNTMTLKSDLEVTQCH